MVEVNAENAGDVARVMKLLAAEFDAGEVKRKPAMVKGNRALALHYIDARCVMDRLDEVVGINGWRDEYTVLPTGEVECRLSVRLGGEWVTKADVGGQSGQPDEGDRMKAAYSDALKRAAVKFGVGRFLYRKPQEWLDYDPVKKKFADPPPVRSDRTPAPKTAEPKPAPRPDNPARLAKIVADLASCKGVPAFNAIVDKVKETWPDLSPGDREKVQRAVEDTKARFK